MTVSARRLVIVTAFLAGFCSLPAVSSAQGCYFDYGIYASLDYEHTTEDTINLYSWGAGIDYSSCGEACGHGYGVDLNITRLPETNLYSNYSSETEFNVPIFGGILTTDPESFKVEFKVTVWCWCAMAVVGQPVAQSTIQVPKCLVPFLPYKGISRGRPVHYKLVGNIAQQSSVADAFNSWTSRNASSGVGVTYSPHEDTNSISGIVVTVGDASTQGGENYGKFDPTVADGRVIGGSLVISDDMDLVWSGDGFRRITQHELGHAHGLNDFPNSPSKGSVMREPITVNGASLADYPTQCDGLRAYQREDN